MDIRKIDKNFQTSFSAPEDLEWYSALSAPFSLHGVYYEHSEKRFRRLKASVAESVNEGVKELSLHTAGGRLRFKTDSPYVAVRAAEPYTWFMPHMTLVGQCGFTLFDNGGYVGTVIPGSDLIMQNGGKNTIEFDALHYATVSCGLSDYTLYFPLYNGVNELYIGLKKGCELLPADEYAHPQPMVFYGSSITQGGCASKPGDDYVNRLSALLDTDIINLGFSGSARAEKTMADYLASLDPSVFVLDYDHNAPNAEHLKNTHYPLYKTIREKHKDTPIVFITMPVFNDRLKLGDYVSERYKVIEETYIRAKKEGDENVYFISGEGLMGSKKEWECGTVDGCHPDSLGFYLMAEAVKPVLENILKGK